ncbi:MAG: LamG domain-containing protein [Pirellulales bacterium]
MNTISGQITHGLVTGTMIVIATLLASPSIASAGLIAEYDFNSSGSVVPDNAPASPNYGLVAEQNGTGFTSANAFGPSPTGTLLGNAGLLTEPVEPTSQEYNYGFTVNKEIIRSLPSWSVLMWVNRRDLDNIDFLFYIGTGDGFSGTGAETYIWGSPSGVLVAENRSSNSVVDMTIAGGQFTAEEWHQVGIVKNGSAMSIYMDGSLIGSDSSVSLNSFDRTGNSVIVFGAGKWMRLPEFRQRVFDGMIDQIEVYDSDLTAHEVADRYQAFAVPEPSSLVLGLCAACGLLLFAHRASSSQCGTNV